MCEIRHFQLKGTPSSTVFLEISLSKTQLTIFYFFLKIFIYLFLEGKGGRKREKHQCMVASCAPPTGDPAHNLGMCPDWELNQQPFGLQASTQSTESHQPGLLFAFGKESVVWERAPGLTSALTPPCTCYGTQDWSLHPSEAVSSPANYT